MVKFQFIFCTKNALCKFANVLAMQIVLNTTDGTQVYNSQETILMLAYNIIMK
jgi:hypothetical protein